MRKKCRGSLTVEAALICPVFIIVILFMVYIIMSFQKAAYVQADIIAKARVFAIGYSVVDSNNTPDSAKDIIIPQIYRADYIPVNIIQKAVVRPFTGIYNLSDEDEDPVVYITGKGKVYHYNIACSYISVKTYKVSYSNVIYKRNKSGGKYSACEICCRDMKNIRGYVYITDYGNRFHISALCKRINHEILTIRLSEVSHMRACSKCSKGR